MPWRGAEHPGEYPTLGYLVGEWIEGMCVIPDGEHQGEPFRLTDEQLRFLLKFFRLKPDAVADLNRPSAPFAYRGSQLMRPQKAGKSPFGGTIAHAHGLGPVLFAGWDAYGEPVGRPHPSPWVQVVATSEEQTDNCWLAMQEMARRGPIADMPGVELGIMDINLPGGGKIEPRSASGRGRLGARITFAVFDETHLMTESNGGVLLATTMKRNLAGMGGRWLEVTNAFDPTENSVAQRTQESDAHDVLVDYRPPPRRPDLTNDQDALELLRYVYGDATWVDLTRILADARDPAVCPTVADAMRYFFNLIEVGTSVAVDPGRWDACAKPGSTLEPGETVCLGFDGTRGTTCTSLVASRVSDGRWFHLRTWNPADYDDGKTPRDQVDKAVTDAFAAYDVRFMYGSSHSWQEYFDIWSGRWPKRVVEFPINVERRMDGAIVRFLAGLAGDFTHDADQLLTAHAKAARLTRGGRKKPGPDDEGTQFYVRVARDRDGGFIDAFIAGLLAEEARGQALEQGAGNEPPPVPAFVSWR